MFGRHHTGALWDLLLFCCAGLLWVRECCVTYWWYFRHHQLAPFVGNTYAFKARYRFSDKRVAWCSLAQWWPLTTFKKKNPQRLHLRSKLRRSPQSWSASPNKTATWRSSWTRKTRHQITKEQIKKELALKGGIKRDHRPATPQVGQSDSTQAFPLLRIRLHHLLSWRCRQWRNRWK